MFGYGSLVWRPAFPYIDRRPAHIDGWARRFWQASTDHRGTPEAPGRVVTLIESPGARCEGAAYQVASDDLEVVLAGLDDREKGGYQRHRIALHLRGPHETISQGLVYVASDGNPHFVGHEPLDTIARTVVRSSGPSGRNDEYVLELARALRELDAMDTHVFALEARVRAHAFAED